MNNYNHNNTSWFSYLECLLEKFVLLAAGLLDGGPGSAPAGDDYDDQREQSAGHQCYLTDGHYLCTFLQQTAVVFAGGGVGVPHATGVLVSVGLDLHQQESAVVVGGCAVNAHATGFVVLGVGPTLAAFYIAIGYYAGLKLNVEEGRHRRICAVIKQNY